MTVRRAPAGSCRAPLPPCRGAHRAGRPRRRSVRWYGSSLGLGERPREDFEQGVLDQVLSFEDRAAPQDPQFAAALLGDPLQAGDVSAFAEMQQHRPGVGQVVYCFLEISAVRAVSGVHVRAFMNRPVGVVRGSQYVIGAPEDPVEPGSVVERVEQIAVQRCDAVGDTVPLGVQPGVFHSIFIDVRRNGRTTGKRSLNGNHPAPQPISSRDDDGVSELVPVSPRNSSAMPVDGE